MKDPIKKALTKHTRRGVEIPPSSTLILAVKFTLAMTLILSALQTTHLLTLHTWNNEIFSAIAALTGTITGILVGQRC